MNDVRRAILSSMTLTTVQARRAGGAALRLGVLLGLYLVYALARNLHGQTLDSAAYAAAVRHGQEVAGWGSWLPSERSFQALWLSHPWAVRTADAYYGSAHVLVTVATLGWLAVRHPRLLDRQGAVLVLATLVGVVVFALHPVAPPRLMPPESGLSTVDTLATFGGLVPYDHGVLEHIADPLAAMPSLHLAWAVWVSLTLRLSDRALLRRLGVAHALLTLTFVLVTGNHWYADAVLGIALTLVLQALIGWRATRVEDRPTPHVTCAP